MRFELESWRKLYRHEPLEQRAWPVTTRALRDHLLRYPEEVDGQLVDASGTLSGHTGDSLVDRVVELLCAALGTHADEKPLIELALRTLIADKYLVITPESVVLIRNFERAQRSPEARKKARQREAKRSGGGGDTTGTPPGQKGDGNGLARARREVEVEVEVDQTRGRSDERGREPQRPVLPPEPLPQPHSARTWEIPPPLLQYAKDLGLSERDRLSAIADFREKVKQSGSIQWLADKLCRFFEQKTQRSAPPESSTTKPAVRTLSGPEGEAEIRRAMGAEK